MIKFGYKLMSEEHGPSSLVRNAVRAEQAGFEFAAISDHFSPWLEEQGHSSFAWSVLGAVAQATRSIGLMTAVTCPIMRYHPAIVAQAAATIALLSNNRFTLGLGSGERLNYPPLAAYLFWAEGLVLRTADASRVANTVTARAVLAISTTIAELLTAGARSKPDPFPPFQA